MSAAERVSQWVRDALSDMVSGVISPAAATFRAIIVIP